MSKPIRVGVVGLGFMGRTHLAALTSAREAGIPCAPVAVADARVSEVLAMSPASGNIATAGQAPPLLPPGARAYTKADELLADPDIDAVCICTPTDTHVELALAALAAGKHVLVEKPVAVGSADVARVRDAAIRSRLVCMPAMVMRFWPGWEWLKDRIVDGRFGPLRSAEFERRGSRPTWNPAFYADAQRSGGALVDLHIHDADFVLWCFGKPTAVTSVGTENQVSTCYHYRGQPTLITAAGGWGQSPGFGFRMRFIANFEHATVDFDLGREKAPLIVSDAAGSQVVDLPRLGGYDAEVRHFIDVLQKRATPRATLEDAYSVALLLEAERKSLQTEATVRV